MITPLLAVLDFTDYAIIAGITLVLAGGASLTTRREVNLLRLERQMRDLQQKLDLLLKHHGIAVPVPPPSGLSPEVELLAGHPDQKIAAIKLYREEHPGTGLAEAKKTIEDYYNKRS